MHIYPGTVVDFAYVVFDMHVYSIRTDVKNPVVQCCAVRRDSVGASARLGCRRLWARPKVPIPRVRQLLLDIEAAHTDAVRSGHQVGEILTRQRAVGGSGAVGSFNLD